MIFLNIEEKISKERQKELTKNNPLKPDDYIQQLFVTNFLNFCFYE